MRNRFALAAALLFACVQLLPAVRADAASINGTQRPGGCILYRLCTDETSTGVCGANDIAASILESTTPRYSVACSGSSTATAWSVNLYTNGSGAQHATIRSLLSAAPLTETDPCETITRPFPDVWGDLESVTLGGGNVDVDLWVCQ